MRCVNWRRIKTLGEKRFHLRRNLGADWESAKTTLNEICEKMWNSLVDRYTHDAHSELEKCKRLILGGSFYDAEQLLSSDIRNKSLANQLIGVMWGYELLRAMEKSNYSEARQIIEFHMSASTFTKKSLVRLIGTKEIAAGKSWDDAVKEGYII